MAASDALGAVDDTALLSLIRAIAAGDLPEVTRRLRASPVLTRAAMVAGASRSDADRYFVSAVGHYAYRGDTALHFAAAAYRSDLATTLIEGGADTRARNRRGAEPLHYAADGAPGADGWDPQAQAAVIACLVGAGADPDTRDQSGVAPLHRAVRTRCSGAVEALLACGADPLLANRSGSTPLHLAVQTTGRSNAGSDAAREEQHRIVGLLLRAGARPTDVDGNGRTVTAAAANDRIRDALDTGAP